MSTRKFLLAFLLQWVSIVSFAKGINPETWSKGRLYELTDADDFVHCLYIMPSGHFIFLQDLDNGLVNRYRGTWKRNSLNGKINFTGYTDIEFWPLDETFYVLNDGLYADKSDAPDFIPAKESTSEFYLPQIELFLDERDPFENFYGLSEIGYRVDEKSWHRDNDSFTMVKISDEMKRAESKAQYESNEYYLKERQQRRKWKYLYPKAWSFAIKEFQPIKSDTARMRAMCNWIATNINYKLKESREQNPSHDPEFVFTEHFGLCLDYSLLLNVFCESIGIPCFNVCGYPLSTSQGKQPSLGNSYHAWNFVKVDGSWKAVDPTWYKTSKPNEHFLEDLSAYQYEHVPHEPAILANPFGPQGEEELNLCPVVKQSNTNLVYVGNFDHITVANGDELEVLLYSFKETDLELFVDSAEHKHHTVSFTITWCFGCSN
ncbi:MAG: transglutaminase domain-containing protein, partial [Flavobacteriales bacterium]